MKLKHRKRICLLALAALLLTGCGAAPDTEVSPPASSTPGKTDWESTVVLNGTTYRRRTDLKTVLFLGVDDTDTVQAEGDIIGNNGRTDAIVLFILDTTNETTQALFISRDTITEVDVYKGNGDLAYSGQMQINMQYAFGNSARRSCFLTERTVSELLYDTRIDSCLSMTMEGISVIVDQLGGVTLTMPEDYTQIDERYREGATVTLNGADAERFVRYRDTAVQGSAETRADRQNWFMRSLLRQIEAQGNLTQSLEQLLEAAQPYIETDLDAETMRMLTSYTLRDETLKVPGSSESGRFHDEYHVDEGALRELILQLFYQSVP